MKVKDIIKILEQFENQNYEMVYDMFGEDDIREHAKDMEITLTKKQVSKIAEYLENNADATEGMSWDTVEDAIEQVTN